MTTYACVCVGSGEDGGIVAGHFIGGGVFHPGSAAAAGEQEHSSRSAAVTRGRHEVVLQGPTGRDPGYTGTLRHLHSHMKA